jgi:transposase InsO family protein
VPVFASLPINGVASAIAASTSCCGTKARHPASTASTGSTARRGWRCANVELAGRRWEAALPSSSRPKPNARWSLDFVHDQLACGRRLRILNIVDDVTRECLAAIPDSSISGKRATRELTMLIERRGKPRMIVSDNGTEFTSNAVLHWSKEHRVEWHYIAPGKPMQNGYIERARNEPPVRL